MNTESITQRASILLLCIAGLAFPFSVAATNVGLAATLVLSVFSGSFWHGCQILRNRYTALSLSFLFMLGFMILSLAWSPDIREGLGKIGHLWFLLLLPALTSMLQYARHRWLFLLSLSIGLTAHLGYCVVQASGYFDLVITSAASSADDPAGHIGHIGFGFVYGLWAGWLILYGLQQHAWRRWVPLALALWSVAMVFIVQGRGGYLTVLVILAAIIWKELMHGKLARRMPWFIGGFILLLVLLATGPGQQRVQQTWQQLQQAVSGDIQHSEARLPLWIATFRAWQQKPLLGHGVGGFKQAFGSVLVDQPHLGTALTQNLAHPHNIYLLAMVREGMVGLLALLGLLALWLHAGWRMDWLQSPAGYLIAAPALALLVNGLTSSSLEEHYSGIIAVMFLSCGLAMAAKDTSVALPPAP